MSEADKNNSNECDQGENVTPGPLTFYLLVRDSSSNPVSTRQKDKPTIANVSMKSEVPNGESSSNRTDNGSKSIANRVSALNSGNRTGISLGISSIVKAYQMRDKFSGSFDENLSGALKIYDTMCSVRRLNGLEKAKALPFILKDEKVSVYIISFKEEKSYEDTSQMNIDN